VWKKTGKLLLLLLLGNQGFLFFILKTTTAGVKMERAAFSVCVVGARWLFFRLAGCVH
jgi:hypothetical protein